MKRRRFLSLMGTAALASGLLLTGCGGGEAADDRRIIRIGHVQSANHPDHLGLTAFADFINEKLGDKYRVEVYPSELLGSQTEMVQLTQTGAIDFVVASNAIMETFSSQYQIFNLPYLFSSEEAYHAAMEDNEVTDPIFLTTQKAGLETVTWLDAGTRNFYTVKTPVNQPSDLKGLKIRVQQSPTNVEMMRLLGGTATPMGFGDVYTALQAGILDGAENNELPTDNGHGDIASITPTTCTRWSPICWWRTTSSSPTSRPTSGPSLRRASSSSIRWSGMPGPLPWKRRRTRPRTSSTSTSSTRTRLRSRRPWHPCTPRCWLPTPSCSRSMTVFRNTTPNTRPQTKERPIWKNFVPR